MYKLNSSLTLHGLDWEGNGSHHAKAEEGFGLGTHTHITPVLCEKGADLCINAVVLPFHPVWPPSQIEQTGCSCHFLKKKKDRYSTV